MPGKKLEKLKYKLIGWREWVALPDLAISKIKAKIDTGARTSALHAINIEEENDHHGNKWVRFEVHPLQRNVKKTIKCRARLIEYRHVKDSSGDTTIRPVIKTALIVGKRSQVMELTLVSRHQMGFRLLLGRTALRKNFIIHPKRSYLAKEVG